MPTPADAIAQWTKRLPRWQQEALALLADRPALTDAELDALTRRALAEVGAEADAPEAAPFANTPQSAPRSAAAPPLRLHAVANLSGVNALAPGQTLTFAPQLTLILGRNGSGKSGYARLLAGSAFTRGDREILPDVRRAPSGPATAEITFEEEGALRTERITAGAPHPLLARFHLFDGSSVQAQLDKEMELSLTPGALQPLSRLGRTIDGVKQRIQAMMQARSRHPDFAALFTGESAVTDLLHSFDATTDPARLERLAAPVADAPAEFARLDQEIGRLTAQSPAGRAAALDQEAAGIDALARALARLRELLPDTLADELRALEAEEQQLADALAALGAASFAVEGLTQTGSPLWRAFVERAHALAHAESTPAYTYPAPGDRCLLCGQPLSTDAAALLHRLWELLGGAAQQELEAARARLEERRAALRTLDTAILRSDSLARRTLGEQNPPQLRILDGLLLRIEERRVRALAPDPLAPPEAPLGSSVRMALIQLENLRDRLIAAAEQARAADPSAEVEALRERRTLLAHRMQLAALLPELTAALDGLRWAARAGQLSTSTVTLTRFYNEIFTDLVSERYLSTFEEYLEKLGRPYLVSVETKGKKGATVKRLKLDDAHASAAKITPGKVLSEGERRAVALADFLTEAALDDDCAGLILDDPATSLDLVWGEAVARLLAAEATRRQVIVFTHDLPFARQLARAAADYDLRSAWHAIARDPATDAPGQITLDAPLPDSW